MNSVKTIKCLSLFDQCWSLLQVTEKWRVRTPGLYSRKHVIKIYDWVWWLVLPWMRAHTIEVWKSSLGVMHLILILPRCLFFFFVEDTDDLCLTTCFRREETARKSGFLKENLPANMFCLRTQSPQREYFTVFLERKPGSLNSELKYSDFSQNSLYGTPPIPSYLLSILMKWEKLH